MMPGLEEDFRTSGPLVSQLEQASAKRRCGRAPREWRNQLWAVAEEAAERLRPGRPVCWLLVEAMTRAGYRLVDAWADVAVLADVVSSLLANRPASSGLDRAKSRPPTRAPRLLQKGGSPWRRQESRWQRRSIR
jgi:hypothetical protein